MALADSASSIIDSIDRVAMGDNRRHTVEVSIEANHGQTMDTIDGTTTAVIHSLPPILVALARSISASDHSTRALVQPLFVYMDCTASSTV